MKKITILLALVLVVGSSFAQKNKKQIIYLKNGSVIKGNLAQVDDQKVAINSGRNIIVINEAEIDTITSKWKPESFDGIKAPYFIKTSIGILAGGSNNSKPTPFSFDASFNYGICPQCYVGAGLGVDLLEESYLPVFLNLEYHFRESQFTPFVGIQGGYMVPLDDHVRTQTYYDMAPWISYWPNYYQETLDNKGGYLINPSFGFVSQVNQNLGISLSFGYRFHKVGFEGDNEYELEREYNRLSIRLGILFN
ncbi:hypothetical protein ACUNWD_05235 [Sunxiuqinia sp. A32]|uniref:hypothetical protein n=1 Tax=Sunxiuqinia sp. A32 TaxID=3461496 RepID=UPI0040465F14